jgi:aminobenzoyl-glutamate transport protein
MANTKYTPCSNPNTSFGASSFEAESVEYSIIHEGRGYASIESFDANNMPMEIFASKPNFVAAFAGTAFGYSVSFFIGSMDMNLIEYTTKAARLIDNTYYVRMTSNLFIMIIASILLALIGTYITEKFIVKKIGRYVSKTKDEFGKTQEIEYLDLQFEEQKKIQEETLEKKGLKYALISAIIVVLIFIYMIIPGLPLSGILLNMDEIGYAKQLFGEASYFQDGFTYMLAIFFMATGIAYAIGAKTLKNDNDLFNKLEKKLSILGVLLVMIFFAAQFITIFKETNIGTLAVVSLTNLIKILPLSGIILIIISFIAIAIANIFIPASLTKWAIISPVLVPMMMQLNISAEFTQFIFRAGESLTNAVTPLLAYFVVYIGYLNIYNKEETRTFSIGKGIRLMIPYLIGFGLVWLVIILLWYIIGLPIGPGTFPTL